MLSCAMNEMMTSASVVVFFICVCLPSHKVNKRCRPLERHFNAIIQTEIII